jgi:hypothetical protein
MLGSYFRLRPNERWPALLAFSFLTVLIASHALLETARDALFLARLPARQLPFVYLAIAGASLVIARLEAKFRRWMPLRVALVTWTGLAATGTAAFWLVRSCGFRHVASALAGFLAGAGRRTRQ